MPEHATIFTVYIAPPLYFTALFLMIFAYLGPVPVGHTTTSLAFIYPAVPMRAVTATKRDFLSDLDVRDFGNEVRKFPRAAIARQVLAATPKVDGPSVRIGILGSCARKTNNANDVCTKPSFDTSYDFSVLPSSAPVMTLGPPATTSVVFLVILIFSVIFFFLHMITILPHQNWFKLPARFLAVANNPILGRVAPWIGIFAFTFGLLMVTMWHVQFSKEVAVFNTKVAALGSKAPQLQASLGNGFKMLWIAYAFSIPSIICALFKRPAGKSI